MVITRGVKSFLRWCDNLDPNKTYELELCGEKFPLVVGNDCNGCILFEIEIGCTFSYEGWINAILLQDTVAIKTKKTWIQ